MAELHSITGMFVESFPGTSPWGGYLIKGANNEDNQIEGQLIDNYGLSSILGTMNDNSLIFKKQYSIEHGNGQSFWYSYELKDGLWIGGYTSTRVYYEGKAICKTHLCIKDMNFRKFDVTTPEGYMKAIIESMVESGMLERFDDQDSGEEMFRPI